jgi:Transcriptional regulator, AbiEi antitoxin
METAKKLCKPFGLIAIDAWPELVWPQKDLARLIHRFLPGGYAHRVLAFKVADRTANFGDLLRANRGFFSRAEAIDSGETDRTLATARREGVIVRLRRGMYAPADSSRQAMTLVSIFSMPGRPWPRSAERLLLRAPRPRPCTVSRSMTKISPMVHLVRLDRGCSHLAAKTNHHVVTQDIEDDLGVFDGKIKYQKLLRPDETASDCVFREKKREDAMRADLRGMTLFIWAEVMPHSSRRTMAELARSLDQSYRLYVRGRTIIAG